MKTLSLGLIIAAVVVIAIILVLWFSARKPTSPPDSTVIPANNGFTSVPLSGIAATNQQRGIEFDSACARRNGSWDTVSTWPGTDSDEQPEDQSGDAQPYARSYYKSSQSSGAHFPANDFPDDSITRTQLSAPEKTREKFSPSLISGDAGAGTLKLSRMDRTMYDAGPWWKTPGGDSQSPPGQYAGLESTGGAYAPGGFYPPNTWYQPTQPYNDWRGYYRT